MNESPTFLRSLKLQRRVIGALLIREMITRYGRHNIGFLWVFAEPMLFTLGVVALWAGLKFVHASHLPVVAFGVTGYSSVLLWRNCANRCAQAITPNLGLLFHRNVRVLDIFLTRIFLELAGITVSVFTLTTLFTVLGMMDLPADMGKVLAGWFYLSWFGSALGLIVGSISELSETAERLWHTVAYLIFPLSGAVFMVDWFPLAAQELLLMIPMVHGTELLRGGYFGETVITHYDTFYMFCAGAVSMLLGLLLMRKAAHQLEFE